MAAASQSYAPLGDERPRSHRFRRSFMVCVAGGAILGALLLAALVDGWETRRQMQELFQAHIKMQANADALAAIVEGQRSQLLVLHERVQLLEAPVEESAVPSPHPSAKAPISVPAVQQMAVKANSSALSGLPNDTMGHTTASLEYVPCAACNRCVMTPVANVAFGAKVVVTGGFTLGALPSIIVSGEYIDDGQAWNDQENVRWTDQGIIFEIELTSFSCITGVTLQADWNDHYRVSVDGATLLDVVPGRPGNDGIITWPFAGRHSVPASVVPTCGTKITVQAHDGDGAYALQGLQLIGFKADSVRGGCADWIFGLRG